MIRKYSKSFVTFCSNLLSFSVSSALALVLAGSWKLERRVGLEKRGTEKYFQVFFYYGQKNIFVGPLCSSPTGKKSE
jgi:hypothetical protein